MEGRLIRTHGVRTDVPALVLLALLFAAPEEGPPARAAGTGDGIAKDALARPLDGTQLRLETPDGRVVGRATADGSGHFVFSGIAPGTYAVIGEKPGFETVTAIVTVAGDVGATVDLTLASRPALD